MAGPSRAATRIILTGSGMALILLSTFAIVVHFAARSILYSDLDDELQTLAVAISSDLELHGLEGYSHEALRAGVEANTMVYRLEHHSAVAFTRNSIVARTGDLGRHVELAEALPFASRREGFFTDTEPFTRQHRVCRFRLLHLRQRAAGTTLVLFRPIEAIQRTVRRIDSGLAMGVIVGLLIIVLTLFFSVRNALEPVRRITAFAAGVSPHDLSRRAAVPAAGEEFRRLADVINSLIERVERAFVAQRRLVADAAHELKTPVAVISAEAQDLERGIIPEGEVPKSLQVISGAAQGLAREIDDLLELARGDAREAAPLELTDLEEVLAEASSLVGPLAAAAGTRVVREGERSAELTCDRRRLVRAVSNLLTNAIRYSPSGSTVELSLATAEGFLCVEVRDRGPGIAPADRQKVFDRFVRLPAARKSHPAGSGLGLAIVEQTVSDLGGRVEIDDRPGGGCVFRVLLPRR